ncbi:hypothetical protein [Geodermatophilus sabuli]|uniref:Uncharacterized protein n=1 Tax=Geodermatophilus sabuli TaxID=1564158 RepID=A0A285EJM8_9ACTN|nr:hypothetical protein [Geodermatophilus sabuli]MBB3083826.1 hypothetical protein [Geodermatophilus sabuli]SNX99339.1 hypothetical protein SAMN06893097_11746 [Geodermatophilus sabuli]
MNSAVDRVRSSQQAAAGPHEPDEGIRPGTRLLLRAFVCLTLLAVGQLLLRPGQTREAFAWHIHAEVTAAFIGAAYAAGAVLSLVALRQRVWSRVRIPVLTVGVFTTLTLGATMLHTHKLQLTDGVPTARGAAWLWLVVYLVVPFACFAVVGRQGWRRRPAPGARRPMPGWLAVLVGVQGAVLTAAGVLLYLGGVAVHHHADAITRFWPWDLMPLSAQVVGAWLIAFGVAAALVIREGDLARLVGPSLAYAVFGGLQLLVLLRYRESVSTGDPWVWAYVGLLLSVVLAGGHGWWTARRDAAVAVPSPAEARRSTGERVAEPVG